MLLHQKCKRCLFQMSVCLSVSLSLALTLRDLGCGCYRNHLAGLNCFFLVFISSYWTSVSFCTLTFFSFSFSPPVSWICMYLFNETLFKMKVHWSLSLSLLSFCRIICSTRSLSPSFIRGNTWGSVYFSLLGVKLKSENDFIAQKRSAGNMTSFAKAHVDFWLSTQLI